MTHRINYLGPIFLVLLALFLRLFELGRVPSALFIDEIWALYQPYLFQEGVYSLSVYSVIVYLLEGTYYSYSLFGASVFFGRLSVAIYGTLLVLVTYFFTNELYGKKVALVSGFLMAICPWAIIYSRYQIVSMAGIFWFTLGTFLVYKGLKLKSRKRLLISGIGIFILGLSISSVVIARIFVPLFLFGFVILCASKVTKWTKWLIFEGFLYLLIFILATTPVLYDYFLTSDVTNRSVSFSTYSYADSALDFVKLVGERFFIHLSPDFLVLTGGLSYSSNSGFQQNISTEAILKYSTGAVGMLNYFGIFAYFAIFYLLYSVVRKKSHIEDKLLLWWIFCSLITVTSAYYDNPNSARAIMALPALVIIMSMFIVILNSSFSTSFYKKRVQKIICSVGLVLIILLPTGYFLSDYFTEYPSRSAKSFDYGYAEVAQFLTDSNNWNRQILLYNLHSRNWNLAFYSPEQPVNPEKFPVLFSISNLLPYIDSTNAFIQIQRPLIFKNGTIDYAVRIDNHYGAASSHSLQLIFDENNKFTFSLYSQNSTYNPNGYLISQMVDGETFLEQNSLRSNIVIGEFYSVKLSVNSTFISIYLNDEFVTCFSRPSSDTYFSCILCAESSAVSFVDFKIVDGLNGKTIVNLNDDILNWQTISGNWGLVENILHGDSNTILIADNSLDLQLLLDNDVQFKILKSINYPAGNLALKVLMVY